MSCDHQRDVGERRPRPDMMPDQSQIHSGDGSRLHAPHTAHANSSLSAQASPHRGHDAARPTETVGAAVSVPDLINIYMWTARRATRTLEWTARRATRTLEWTARRATRTTTRIVIHRLATFAERPQRPETNQPRHRRNLLDLDDLCLGQQLVRARDRRPRRRTDVTATTPRLTMRTRRRQMRCMPRSNAQQRLTTHTAPLPPQRSHLCHDALMPLAGEPADRLPNRQRLTNRQRNLRRTRSSEQRQIIAHPTIVARQRPAPVDSDIHRGQPAMTESTSPMS